MGSEFPSSTSGGMLLPFKPCHINIQIVVKATYIKEESE